VSNLSLLLLQTATSQRIHLQRETSYRPKFESSWYFLSTETKTWKESRQDCLERGADLVIIDGRKEQKRVWIGLTDSVIEGTWKWVDGTPLITGPLKAWNDLSCAENLYWICEKVV
uniref:C-type lectin domain-containing protein n=1 Tax=Oncorhynchus mykiss TaxID=8022 RepID=A0A8C7PF81_ONCMY